MPNHVSFRLEFRSDDNNYEAVKARFEEMKKLMKGEGDTPQFDFNKLIPMPEELRGSRSPVEIVAEAELEAKKKEVDEYNAKPENKNWKREYPITRAIQVSLLERFGADNWYDWSVENWGTKWNAYEVSWGWGDVYFQCAWSYPEVIFEALSKLFPDVTIDIEYADEDFGSNCGIVSWRNGVEISRRDNKNEPEYPWHLFAKKLYYQVNYNHESDENRELREENRKLKGEN